MPRGLNKTPSHTEIFRHTVAQVAFQEPPIPEVEDHASFVFSWSARLSDVGLRRQPASYGTTTKRGLDSALSPANSAEMSRAECH
jgi:hypothetical protein